MPFKTFLATGALGLSISVLPLMTSAQSTNAQSTEAQSTEAQSTEAQSTEAQSTETQSTETQSTAPETEEGALFVPIVAECVDTPDATNCGQVRAVVTECAADLDEALCDVLFVDTDEVFGDADLQERAQMLLSETSDAIAEMEFEDAHEGEIGDVVEETRANAERTMLRGDENLNSHSSPPLAVEE